MKTYSRIHISLGYAASSIALVAIFVVALAWSARPSDAQTPNELLMFEEPGCIWCAQWNAEVGPEYPITPEGIAAPLRRINIHLPLPEAYELASRPRYTPTFVLVTDGVEVGRIEGYPGEDFFWGLLGRLLRQAAPDS